MKHSILLLLFPVLLYSQAKIDTVNQTIYLREVREIDLPAKELKDKAFDWVAKAYNNSNHVVRVNEDDRLILKGSHKVSAIQQSGKYSIPRSFDIGYTMDLEFKDGRYKMEILQLEETSEIVWKYLLSWEAFKTYRIKMAEDYQGPGKKSIMRRLDKEDKLLEDYNSSKDLANTVVGEMIDYLNALENSLHNYLKTDQQNDW